MNNDRIKEINAIIGPSLELTTHTSQDALYLMIFPYVKISGEVMASNPNWEEVLKNTMVEILEEQIRKLNEAFK